MISVWQFFFCYRWKRNPINSTVSKRHSKIDSIIIDDHRWNQQNNKKNKFITKCTQKVIFLCLTIFGCLLKIATELCVFICDSHLSWMMYDWKSYWFRSYFFVKYGILENEIDIDTNHNGNKKKKKRYFMAFPVHGYQIG